VPLRNQFESEAEWLEHMRMYFAAKALPAYLSHVSDGGSAILSRCYAEAAKEAYEIADAMLGAREAKP